MLLLSLISLSFSACKRNQEDLPVMPPATHPLARTYIGYGVVNVSFTHLLDEMGQAGVSIGYLRRGTVVRIIERRQQITRDRSESWVLAEGNYLGQGSGTQGWLEESSLEIFDSENRAITASRTLSQ